MAKPVYTVYVPIEGAMVIKTEKADFESFQKYVGGSVERVVCPLNSERVALTMFCLGDPGLMTLAELITKPTQAVWLCNEEGKLKGLGINPRATLLMGLGYEIVGDVVLLLNWDID